MNNLPKEKRDQLILVAIGTVFLLALIGLGLIRPQYAAISEIDNNINRTHNHVQSMDDVIKKSDVISAQLADLTYTLGRRRVTWLPVTRLNGFTTPVRNFKEHHKVDISVNSQLSIGEVELLPHFPYKELKVTVGENGIYP